MSVRKQKLRFSVPPQSPLPSRTTAKSNRTKCCSIAWRCTVLAPSLSRLAAPTTRCRHGSPGRPPRSAYARSTGSAPPRSPQESPNASAAKMPPSRFLRTKNAPRSQKCLAAAPCHSLRRPCAGILNTLRQRVILSERECLLLEFLQRKPALGRRSQGCSFGEPVLLPHCLVFAQALQAV